jgi:hypothetical protein
MLRIELAALSAQELKRLLDMARARNQGALAEQLVAELEARPHRVEDWSPLPMSYAPPPAYEPVETHLTPRRSGAMAATAAIAAFVSAAVTWGISVPPASRDAAQATAAPPAPRAAVVLASLDPASPPPGFGEPSPPEAAAAESATGEPERVPVRMAARATTPAKSRTNPCYGLTTAAERLVCGYPGLAAQDRQLRAAYDRALSAGADRRDLDRGQALWRQASQNVSDRQALAERYARRIRELEVAATPPPPPPPQPRPEDPPF